MYKNRKFLKNIEAKVFSYTTLFLMILVTISGVFVLMPNNTIIVSAVDYSSWDSEYTVNITNTNATSLTNYQVKVVLNTSNFNYIDAQLGNGSDIRFSDIDDDPEYSYWRESWNTGGDSIFWVNVTDTIPGSGYKEILIHVNNSGATPWNNTEGGKDTFLFFDKFGTDYFHSGGGYNSSLWSESLGSGASITNNTDNITLYSPLDNNNVGLISDSSYGNTNCSFDVMFKIEEWGGGSANDKEMGYGIAETGTLAWASVNRTSVHWDAYDSGITDSFIVRTEYNDSGADKTLLYDDTDTGTFGRIYHVYSIYRANSTWYRIFCDYNDSLFSNDDWINLESSFNNYFILRGRAGNDPSKFSVNWSRIRTIVNPEPTTIVLSGSGIVSSNYTISGYNASGFITWSGTAGTTVWSNATSFGTLEVIYHVNSTDNLTDICINMNASDMDNGFDISNITVYVSFDNSSFAVLEDNVGNGNGVFATGFNLTINASTWPASDPGGDPNFPIDPIGWEHDTIYLRFTLNIPSSMSGGTYSSGGTDWSVDFKIIS